MMLQRDRTRRRIGLSAAGGQEEEDDGEAFHDRRRQAIGDRRQRHSIFLSPVA
jgi:hypothetical protein